MKQHLQAHEAKDKPALRLGTRDPQNLYVKWLFWGLVKQTASVSVC